MTKNTNQNNVFARTTLVNADNKELPYAQLIVRELVKPTENATHIVDVLADVPQLGRICIGKFRARFRAPIELTVPRIPDATGGWTDDPSFPVILKQYQVRRHAEKLVTEGLGLKVIEITAAVEDEAVEDEVVVDTVIDAVAGAATEAGEEEGPHEESHD